MKQIDSSAPFVHSHKVRFGETDAARIVYTCRFFEYALDAIDAWFEAVVGDDLFTMNTVRGISCPFVHAEIDFKSPLRPGVVLSSEVLIERLGRSSLSFKVIGRHESGVSYIGNFALVFVELATMKSIPIPEAVARLIADYKERCGSAFNGLDEDTVGEQNL
jgi:4-hydroxybenzoyl-CoA thioesterase